MKNIAWKVRAKTGTMAGVRSLAGYAMTRDNEPLAFVIMVNGRKVPSPIRQEIVSIRGIVAGEYTVNVYHFAALTGKPVGVSVKVEKLNPTVQVVHYDTVALDHGGTEKTAVRFALDSGGKVVEVNRAEKSLVRILNKRKDIP